MNISIFVHYIFRSIWIESIISLIIHFKPRCIFNEYLNKVFSITTKLGIIIKECIDIICFQKSCECTRCSNIHFLQYLSCSTYRRVYYITFRFTYTTIDKTIIDDIRKYTSLPIRFCTNVYRYLFKLFRRNRFS